MRKLIWCGSAAGVLVVGGMIAVSYYAGCHPHSTVGRCISAAARATLVIQPAAHFGATAMKSGHHAMQAQGPASAAIPADPQPIVPPAAMDPEPAEAGAEENAGPEENHDTAPIVIKEEELLPPTVESGYGPPTDIEAPKAVEQKQPDSAYPMFMPLCTDEDEEPASTDANKDKDEENSLKTNADEAFKEWMKLFKGGQETNEATHPEDMPEPPPSVPMLQEDNHRHEHYSGCPHTTGPCSGKCRPSAKKAGREEASEEPEQPKKRDKKVPGKECDKSKSCPNPSGVDTMEFRKSDGRLDEYGHGPF